MDSYIGFAAVYLYRCEKDNKIIDVNVYKKLVELDTKLGTPSSEQLFVCLSNTTRWDLIKVLFNANHYAYLFIIYLRLSILSRSENMKW